MLRYKLRTLLIVLSLGPPVLAYLGPPFVAWLNRPQPQLKAHINGPGSRSGMIRIHGDQIMPDLKE